MSQRERILAHLKGGKAITPLDAWRMFRCYRLGARIHEIRRRGYNVINTWQRDGDKRFARYKLVRG